MTTQKFKVGDWVKFTNEAKEMLGSSDNNLYKVKSVEIGWVTIDSNRAYKEKWLFVPSTPELIAHLEAKSNELIQAEFAAKNERYEIDRQIHLLKTNTELL